ncbi:MAG: tyrosine-type recombinase/integrase [Chitinispirillia bacterium]|nr:tyrosine-type recombinase/integrase [Chitinispirillia bacterium]MCL2242183.1 tyrosine-type recombinase/integrase [Chitinispirillia bacterium]
MGKAPTCPTGLRCRPKADGTPVYYLNTTVDGIWLTERAGGNLKAAKALLAKRTAEIYEGKHFPRRAPCGDLLRHICAEYAERRLLHVKSGPDRVLHFKPIDRLLGLIPVTKLRVSDVEEYQRARLQERKVIRYKEDGVWLERSGSFISPSTIDHETNELMMALDWAVMERLIEYNPIKALKKVGVAEPKRIMLDDGREGGPEWQLLYNASPVWLKNIIECQYLTGMRIGEVMALKWNMVNTVTGFITLPAAVTKTCRGRKIPMYPRLVDLLLSLPKAHSEVFVGANGAPVQTHAVIKAFSRVTKTVSMPHITTHALRRTRGQIWDDVDRFMSSEALGHDEKVHGKHYTEAKERSLISLVGSAKTGN